MPLYSEAKHGPLEGSQTSHESGEVLRMLKERGTGDEAMHEQALRQLQSSLDTLQPGETVEGFSPVWSVSCG